MSKELHELLGAYALGAVDQNEVDAVERLIETDDDARTEAEQHRAVVELLGAMQMSLPPEEIWERVATAVEPQDELAQRRRRFDVWQAVAAVLILVLGTVAVLQSREISTLNDTVTAQETEITDLSATVAADPLTTAADRATDAAFETVSLVSDSSTSIDMTIVLLENGRAYVTGSNLDQLPAGRTYQLWAIMDDDRIISAAVLGQNPDVDTFVVDLDGLVGFAVTEEIDGGVVVSENPAVVVGLLDA